MKNYFVTLAFIVVILISCEDNTLIENYSQDFLIEKVQKERTAKKAWIPYEERNLSLRETETRSAFNMSKGSVVGRMYNYKEDDSQHYFDNVGIKIFDMDRFRTDFPGFYWEKSSMSQYADYVSFSTFDKYENYIKDTKTVNGGFSLNLGLFSIGAKHKYSKIFTENVINENNRVFGQLSIQITDSIYYIEMSENIKNILKSYIAPEFYMEYYMNTPSNFFDRYGSFAVSGFYTGGGIRSIIYRHI